MHNLVYFIIRWPLFVDIFGFCKQVAR